jgi:hypothetical protein
MPLKRLNSHLFKSTGAERVLDFSHQRREGDEDLPHTAFHRFETVATGSISSMFGVQRR